MKTNMKEINLNEMKAVTGAGITDFPPIPEIEIQGDPVFKGCGLYPFPPKPVKPVVVDPTK